MQLFGLPDAIPQRIQCSTEGTPRETEVSPLVMVVIVAVRSAERNRIIPQVIVVMVAMVDDGLLLLALRIGVAEAYLLRCHTCKHNNAGETCFVERDIHH